MYFSFLLRLHERSRCHMMAFRHDSFPLLGIGFFFLGIPNPDEG